MKGFKINIESTVSANGDFRQVLYTGKHSQLVIMTLKPSEEIGMETHPDNDQFFRFEEGEGRVVIDGNEYTVTGSDVVIVPAGSQHNVINISSTHHLRLYTLYSPPHHRDRIIHKTKEEALADSEEFDGTTTE